MSIQSRGDLRGQVFSVKSGRIDRRSQKVGNCYLNSGRNMEKGYGYVEGYCITKSNGFKFGHAWNVDKDGNHLDFTLDDPENHEYIGIIIPNRTVNDVVFNNGGIWFAVLPFIEEEDLLVD